MPKQTLPPLTARADRRRAADEAWQAYVRQGVGPSGVREEILRSWRRARDTYRIDPAKPRPDRTLDPAALEERCARDDVFRLASPILAEFTERLGLSEAVLAWCDADGWMLHVGGDPRVAERAGEIGFRPGASWSEEVVGTCGPGTALAEATAIEVFASEHFVAACHPWSGAAAPVLAPGDPRPVGVVDITAPWQVQRRHAILIARAIALAVEDRLRAAASVRDEVVRFALRGAREGGDALVAVDARGRVLGTTESAIPGALLASAGTLSPAAQEAVAGALRGDGGGIDGDVQVTLPAGGVLVASPVRYGGAAVGAILRVPRAAVRPRTGAAEVGRGAPRPGGRGGRRGAADASERAALLAALDATAWNVVRAASRLGVSRMTLYRRLQRHGLARGRADCAPDT